MQSHRSFIATTVAAGSNSSRLCLPTNSHGGAWWQKSYSSTRVLTPHGSPVSSRALAPVSRHICGLEVAGEALEVSCMSRKSIAARARYRWWSDLSHKKRRFLWRVKFVDRLRCGCYRRSQWGTRASQQSLFSDPPTSWMHCCCIA